MLDQLRKRRDENQIHPHEWRFREKPKKRYSSQSSHSLPNKPSRSIFRDVAIPYSMRKGCDAPPTIQAYPSLGHMASLLLLIECLEKLRRDTEDSTTLKNSCPHDVDIWQFYARLAIKRFKLWISNIESIVRHSAVFNRYGTGSHLHGAFTVNYIPPLDVLLVWFCYLQNSSAYERLLASNDFKLLAQISFPWHVLPTVIDQQTLTFTFSEAAEILWNNCVAVPAQLEECITFDLDRTDLAFTSSDNDLMDMVVQQTNIFQQIHRFHWLRSPAVSGTLQRALKRYVDVTVVGFQSISQTQQIPIVQEENSRDIADLGLDLGQLLALQAHKGYHAAWTSFSQAHNLWEADRPPPPAYRRNITRSINSLNDIHMITQTDVSLEKCFCWICERVKDEIQESVTVPDLLLLDPTSSPDIMDDKRSMTDSSSSNSEGDNDLLLSRKQIKQIKSEIELYKHIEANREKAALSQTK